MNTPFTNPQKLDRISIYRNVFVDEFGEILNPMNTEFTRPVVARIRSRLWNSCRVYGESVTFIRTINPDGSDGYYVWNKETDQLMARCASIRELARYLCILFITGFPPCSPERWQDRGFQPSSARLAPTKKKRQQAKPTGARVSASQ